MVDHRNSANRLKKLALTTVLSKTITQRGIDDEFKRRLDNLDIECEEIILDLMIKLDQYRIDTDDISERLTQLTL